MSHKINLTKYWQKQQNNRAFSIVEISIVILIISLLMAGILNGTFLIGDASLATAQKLTTNSDVNNMESLTLWLETSFSSSLEAQNNAKIENNVKIASWKDISPLKPVTKRLNLTQLTSNNQPEYKENVTEGLPMLYFKGSSNNFLEFTSQNIVLADVLQNNQATIFMVYMFDKSANGTRLVRFGTTDVVNFGYDNRRIAIKFADDTLTEGSDSLKLETLQMLTAVKNANNISLYLNGNRRASSTTSNSTISDNNFGNAGIMRIRVGENFIGWLGEILVFNTALGNKERLQVEQYLLTKWKIKK